MTTRWTSADGRRLRTFTIPAVSRCSKARHRAAGCREAEPQLLFRVRLASTEIVRGVAIGPEADLGIAAIGGGVAKVGVKADRSLSLCKRAINESCGNRTPKSASAMLRRRV